MQRIPISWARKIGQVKGAYRVVIIGVDDDGTYCITTWGATRADCQSLERWSESDAGERVAVEVSDA